MADIIDRLRAALAGRYEIVRKAGSGGMATVYLATDLRHKRKVALKVLRSELSATMGPERFLQEVRVTATLQHPHILPLFDSGEAGGFLYYVMPFVDGESLRERIAREGELPVPEGVRILRDVVDALAAAHALGIVHRDIKPENILLSGRHAWVTDFGVAKAVSEATGRHLVTSVGVALGTPAYMAPEQAVADEHIDHRADIYAVGAVAYELLTGKPPFTGRTTQQILAAQLMEKASPVSEQRETVPPGLDALVMRCLEKRPADRWQRVEEMLPHLESFAAPSGGITPAQNAPAAVKRALPIWVKAAIPAVAGAVAVALLIGLRSSGTAVEAGGDEALASGEARRLIVVPLENLTGDPEVDVWSQLSAEWIGRAIDQPRPVDVVPASAVRDAIKALGADASVTALAERLGARWAVAGSLARTGEQVRFEVEFREVASGERLRSLDPVVGPVDSIEAVVGRLANVAAAAAVTLLDPGAPPWYSTISLAPSVQLFRDYLVQGELFCQGQELESIHAGDRVLEQAPDFIPALLFLRVAYSNLNRNLEADSLTLLLERLRDRMTAAEVAEQDWMWGNIYGDPTRSMRGADALYRFDPTGAGANKAGLTYQRANRLQGALDRFLTMDLEAPCVREWEPWWINTANTYHLLGRFEEELQLAHRGLERFPEARGLLDRELSALAALGRVEAVDSVLDFIDNLPPAPGDGSRAEGVSLELRAHGHREAAQATARRAVEWYADAPAVERPALGGALYAAGRWSDVDTLFASLLLTAPENFTYLRRRGVALARLGRREEALEMSRRLELLDGRPNVRGNHFAGQSEIAAALGERDEAVRLLRRAFDVGYAYAIAIHRHPAYDGMWGYAPWENLVRPRP